MYLSNFYILKKCIIPYFIRSTSVLDVAELGKLLTKIFIFILPRLKSAPIYLNRIKNACEYIELLIRNREFRSHSFRFLKIRFCEISVRKRKVFFYKTETGPFVVCSL